MTFDLKITIQRLFHRKRFGYNGIIIGLFVIEITFIFNEYSRTQSVHGNGSSQTTSRAVKIFFEVN